MPQQLSFMDLEEPAPVKLQNQTPQRWFNTYGSYIIETIWNPKTMTYDSLYHDYNKPDLGLMPNE